MADSSSFSLLSLFWNIMKTLSVFICTYSLPSISIVLHTHTQTKSESNPRSPHLFAFYHFISGCCMFYIESSSSIAISPDTCRRRFYFIIKIMQRWTRWALDRAFTWNDVKIWWQKLPRKLCRQTRMPTSAAMAAVVVVKVLKTQQNGK